MEITLESFESQLYEIREAGFKPIAVSYMYFGNVFVFETEQEAIQAYKKLEKRKKKPIIGFWFGKDIFSKITKRIENPQREDFRELQIFWLD